MKLLHLKISNVKTFQEINLTFGKCNFVTGYNLDTQDSNGIGKSGVVESILLLLYGPKIVDINLADFVRMGEEKAEIEGEVETSSGDLLTITRELKREGASKLKVLLNGNDSKSKTSKDYQEIIDQHIGTPENFEKFRVINSDSESNILNFSSGQLRKSLMAMCQDKFDGLRKKLLDKKSHFEKFNKDAVLYKHAPSEKRLAVLTNVLTAFDSCDLQKIKNKLAEYQKDKFDLMNKKGQLDKDKEIKSKQKEKFQSLSECPTCLQKVSKEYKEPILKSLNEQLEKLNPQLNEIKEKMEIYADILSCEERKRDKIQKQKEKINTLKYKLESRLKQKEYKYTKADIELTKETIDVLDKFASYYLSEWVKTIEPLVNSYIAKLNMGFKFIPNEKGDIDIIIYRDDKEYHYKQLSKGEKTFVAFVFKLSLLLQANEIGLMLADEGFESLSTPNLARVVSIVDQLPVQLIFVSHNPEVNLKSVRTIYIEKENGQSKITKA